MTSAFLAHKAVRAAAYVWASPYSLLGLLAGLFMVACGGSARLHRGVVEFGGGAIGRLASRPPAPFCFCAMTLGHVVVGIDHAVLGRVRAHEHVHVRQYERWGPLFVPAYCMSSALQWVRGRRP